MRTLEPWLVGEVAFRGLGWLLNRVSTTAGLHTSRNTPNPTPSGHVGLGLDI